MALVQLLLLSIVKILFLSDSIEEFVELDSYMYYMLGNITEVLFFLILCCKCIPLWVISVSMVISAAG